MELIGEVCTGTELSEFAGVLEKEGGLKHLVRIVALDHCDNDDSDWTSPDTFSIYCEAITAEGEARELFLTFGFSKSEFDSVYYSHWDMWN
jgi:hypothetical protein